jgi:hypothetical protein
MAAHQQQLSSGQHARNACGTLVIRFAERFVDASDRIRPRSGQHIHKASRTDGWLERGTGHRPRERIKPSASFSLTRLDCNRREPNQNPSAR